MAEDDKKEYFSRAVVTMTIEVSGAGSWGKGATIEQVMRQGGREAIADVTEALRNCSGTVKVIGEPKVGFSIWTPGDKS